MENGEGSGKRSGKGKGSGKRRPNSASFSAEREAERKAEIEAKKGSLENEDKKEVTEEKGRLKIGCSRLLSYALSLSLILFWLWTLWFVLGYSLWRMKML